MKVREVMTENVKVCSPETNLAAAAEILWNADCGILPVVDSGGQILGVITDRDICIAAGTRGLLASDIAVKDVISGKAFVCLPETDIHDALETMRKQGVRRLPVVNSEAQLEGILSLNDVAVSADPSGKTKSDLSLADVALTLKSLCQQPLELQAEQARPKAAPAT